MKKKILITGGAGFIGSHLALELLSAGYDVRALDCLSPQVHGDGGGFPEYLDSQVELIVGDVRDRDTLRSALKDVDAVFHFAAKVGVGQSMYRIEDYTISNNVGTSVLLEELINRPVERLIVASSMSIYGEGDYRDRSDAIHRCNERSLNQLISRDWEMRSANGEILEPIPTTESKPPSLASVYALSKYDQERMCLIAGRAYGFSTVALRFFNVYGPYQALSNPYTGVLAIFASQLLNGHSPTIFEDGLQRRDFVDVRDVAQACRLALEAKDLAEQVFNVGSGRNFTVLDVARKLSATLGKDYIEPHLSGKYRAGDIRHCFADISLAQNQLGYNPEITFEEGLAGLADWLEGQMAVDRAAEAGYELQKRGLTV